MTRLPFVLLSALVVLVSAGKSATNEVVSVAAAANLVYPLEALNAAFRQTTPDVTVRTTTAASGSLFAQITSGAPFDVFLSADTEYPAKLVAAGHADAASLRVFATGRLVLWTTRTDLDLTDTAALIRSARVKKIAIAQPQTAPYGRAAQAALEKLALWSDAKPKLVFGESITQTAQFVETGHADVGLVALSLVLSPRLKTKGTWHEIAPELYSAESLDHAAVLITRRLANPAAQRYLDFLASDAAQKILREFGYHGKSDK